MNETLLGYFNLIEKHHWWWGGRRQLLSQNICKNKNLRILEIGCGTGESITFLEENLQDPEIYGLDTSSVALEFAKTRGHVKLINADGCSLPLPGYMFDYVLMLDTIEHIKNDKFILQEASRVIKKGGKIIITAPALELIWTNHDSEQGHFRRYTRRKLLQLAEETGLNINKIGYFNFLLSPIIIFIRLLSKLKPFSKLGDFDSGINYRIANIDLINRIIRFLFVNEIKLMNYFNYPWGISLFCILGK